VLLNIRVELMTLPDLHPSFLGDTSEMLFMTTPTIAERYADTRAVKAYAALSRKAPLVPFEYAPQPLGAEDIEIAVDYCGICHSDISMIDDAWGYSAFPLVPGHEVIGTVAAIGRHVEVLRIGQRVGLGWQAASCMACHQCRAGDHNLCQHEERTIVHRHGGFADRVRCHWTFALPLPEVLTAETSGPLFCAGIAVFNAMMQFAIKPPDRVGVVGIGGLGHLALQFLNKWGCEVFAFTSNEAKREGAMRLGAHRVVVLRDAAAMAGIAGSLNAVMSTVDVELDWSKIMAALEPKGQLVLLGAVLDPVPIAVPSLLMYQRAITSCPAGSPSTLSAMLDFCARHNIAPVTETFPLTRVNEALDHFRAGKSRFRIVLKNDL
jgi:alcohol/geraniol dehydrogenase (NADP+)